MKHWLIVALLSLSKLTGCQRLALVPAQTQDQADFVSALHAGNVAAVQVKIAAGFPVNAPIPISAPEGDLQMTPLMMAALDGQVNLAQLLVKAGADPRAKDEHGRTAVFFVPSATSDETGLAMMRYLAFAGAPTDEPDDRSSAPLMYSVAANNPLQVQYLLDRGADANRRATDGDCPLFHAVLMGNVEMVESLVQHGAQVNARQADGGTVLLSLPEFRLPQDSEQQIALFLLLHGADPNLADRNGFAPLLNALRNNDTDLAKLLLRFHADPNAGGKSKKLNALMICVETRNYDMARTLIAYHADPNVALEPDGISAYALARQIGDPQMLAALGGR